MGKKNKNKEEETPDEYVIDLVKGAFPDIEILLKDQDGKVIFENEKTKEKQIA